MYPAEEAIADAAAKKTTQLILIEGGKDAATVAVGEVAETGLLAVGRGVLTTVAAPAVAFFSTLLWSSNLNSGEDEWLAAQASANKPLSKPFAVPRQNSETIQKCPREITCPPHDWVLESSSSVEEALADLQKKIDKNSNKPSKAGMLRGDQFEKDALDINSKMRPVESANNIYKCRRCPAEQEVDIIFKDGQIAESKSRNFNQVSKRKEQPKRLLDIQAFFNCQNGKNLKPLAKLDNNLPDAENSAKEFRDRGFEIERLNTRN